MKQQHQQQQHPQQQQQHQYQQQHQQRATWHGLETIIVMTSITTWNVAMMVETVVDVTYKQTTAQNANALIPMEVGVEQLAHLLQQQQFQLQTGEEVHTCYEVKCYVSSTLPTYVFF